MSRIHQTSSDAAALVRSAYGIEFDEDEETCRLTYDPAVDDASLAVVAAVSAATRTDPVEVEPLHAAVDTGALDELFAAAAVDGARERFSVTFQLSTVEATVDSAGIVDVERRCT